jgi:hypothetical protein
MATLHPPSLRPDLPRFAGFAESNTRAWLENYHRQCSACGLDPAAVFPIHAVSEVCDELQRRGVKFTAGAWKELRAAVLKAYPTEVNVVQLH